MMRGFTIVELLITMAIMAILLGISVLGIRSALANGRDVERKNDIAAIARGLEARYNSGNAVLTTPAGSTFKGSYPDMYEVGHMAGENRSSSGWIPAQISGGYITKNLPGVSTATLTGPNGKVGWYLECSEQSNVPGCSTIYTGDNNSNHVSALNTAFNGSDNKDRYVYEPVDSNGYLCSNQCPNYNLYWISETDQSSYLGIAGLKVWKSKHR